MLNFLFEVREVHEVLVYRSSVSIYSFRNFWWGIASCKNVFFEEKTRDKYVCHGQMISLNAEMARVANVERGNFVCEYHWHILRTTNNIRPYPLPSHPRAMNPTLIPAKLFQVFDEVGKACLSIEPERGGAPITSKVVFQKGKATCLPGYNRVISPWGLEQVRFYVEEGNNT